MNPSSRAQSPFDSNHCTCSPVEAAFLDGLVRSIIGPQVSSETGDPAESPFGSIPCGTEGHLAEVTIVVILGIGELEPATAGESR